MAKVGKDIDRSPTHLLHRAGQCAAEMFASDARTGGLTPRQLAVMTVIGDKEGLNQTELVERTGIDRSTMADLVARLTRRGLVQRRRTKEDARAYAIKLSQHGARLLREAKPGAAAADQRLIACLPASKRQDFLDALDTIVNTANKARR
ncbi:MAG: MarR family winged helix-turn-helix transcriptional regulator [Methyloceanibacter sp.]